MSNMLNLFESNKYEYKNNCDIIKRDKVYLKLLSTLGTKDIFRWLPNGKYIENKKIFIIGQYKIVTRAHNNYFKEINDEIRKNHKYIKDINRSMLQGIDVLKQLIQYVEADSKLDNFINLLSGHMLALDNMKKELNNPQQIPIGTVYGSLASNNLIQVYADIENITEDIAVDQLAKEFKITADPFEEIEFGYAKKWNHAPG